MPIEDVLLVLIGAVLGWALERVGVLKTWREAYQRRKELEGRIEGLKEALEAVAIVMHQVELGYGSSGMSNNDWNHAMTYLVGIDHDLQLQITDARGKR